MFIKKYRFPGADPASTPPPHQGGEIHPGARASRPHPFSFIEAAERQREFAGIHPVGGNGIGQSEGDPGCCRLIQVGGDGRGCARLGAGGTPALPGGHHRAGGTPALPGGHHCAGGTPALPGGHHRAGGTPALPGSHHCAGGTPALPGGSLLCAGRPLCRKP